jgi:hypothetical protein
MSYSAEQVLILTERCERFRGSKAPDGCPGSLALCIVDSVQSTMVKYPTVQKVIRNYCAYRREQGGDPNTDCAVDLAATFEKLKGHEAWAERIGNGNGTSWSTARTARAKSTSVEAG